MNIFDLINGCTIVPFTAKRSAAAVPPANDATGGAVDDDEVQGLSIITDPRALSYPSLVLLISACWQGLQRIDSQFQSPYIPFGLCLVFGLIITVSNLQKLKPNLLGCILGVLSGLCNSIIMYSAVVGGQPALEQLTQHAPLQSILSNASVVK